MKDTTNNTTANSNNNVVEANNTTANAVEQVAKSMNVSVDTLTTMAQGLGLSVEAFAKATSKAKASEVKAEEKKAERQAMRIERINEAITAHNAGLSEALFPAVRAYSVQEGDCLESVKQSIEADIEELQTAIKSAKVILKAITGKGSTGNGTRSTVADNSQVITDGVDSIDGLSKGKFICCLIQLGYSNEECRPYLALFNGNCNYGHIPSYRSKLNNGKIVLTEAEIELVQKYLDNE